jgi:hypothetical protein
MQGGAARLTRDGRGPMLRACGSVALTEFTVSSFEAFAGLLVAARLLAVDPGPLDRGRALGEPGRHPAGLAGALRAVGLAGVVRDMARRAMAAEAFTHDGWAKDDARRLFWQVAPAAFDDPDALGGKRLEPKAAVNRMLAAIEAADARGGDFAATALAERYFREVTEAALAVLAERAVVVEPEEWRRALRDRGLAPDAG